MIWLSIIIGVLLVAAVVWFIRHQRSLRLRAYLMEEAMNNHDFSFRLSTKGLLYGERAMQEALNHLGETIRKQINQNEVESWERLTRVLTHEIMNATAPIASISQSMLGRDDVKGTPLEEGIHAIHATSQHLNAFVDSYRKISQLQQTDIKEIVLADIIRDIRQLYPDITWDAYVADDIIVCADPNMLRQIIINLVKNAIEAGAQHIGIEVSDNHLYISNDGQPIPAEARQSIFVPFFTTKRTGNGIGLSLSRRMMIQQGGSLTLTDHPLSGYHTTFSISFAEK